MPNANGHRLSPFRAPKHAQSRLDRHAESGRLADRRVTLGNETLLLLSWGLVQSNRCLDETVYGIKRYGTTKAACCLQGGWNPPHD